MGLAPASDQFFARISASLSVVDLQRVRAAWVLAKAAHSGQRRQSGEAYDTHPLAVAEILFDLVCADADSLCAALLHDVVEDSNTSLASVRSEFGGAVAHIVDGVSKLESVDASGNGALTSKENTLRKLVGAGGHDWRVFAVKLCDRLHNMRTLGSVGRQKQFRVATETSLLYAPLARYVGLEQIASELEALSFRWRFPWRWSILEKWIQYKSEVDRKRLRVILAVTEVSAAHGALDESNRISNEMLVKAVRLLRGDRAGRALFSIPTVYEVTPSIESAYGRIAGLHRRFPCLPASFVCLSNEGWVSSKISSAALSLVAEFVFLFPRVARSEIGFASNVVIDGGDFAAMAGIRHVSGDFTRVLRELVQGTSIAVFSPKGKRFALPRHSTGLDFAFAIHTDIGLRASAVKINGRLCETRVELSSGDIVEVIATESVIALPEWEAILKSPRSRAKLRHWLRERAHDDASILGRRLLASAGGVNENDDKLLYQNFQSLSQILGVTTREDLWRRVGTGDMSAFGVASQLLGSGAAPLLHTTNSADARSRLLLDGHPTAGVQYCGVCMPVSGDAILAVASFAGVKIHRSICPSSAEGRTAHDVFSPIWASRQVQPLPVQLLIEAVDRKGLLADCARAMSERGINVTSATSLSSVTTFGSVAKLSFTILIKSVVKLETSLQALRAVRGVTYAIRADVAIREGDTFA